MRYNGDHPRVCGEHASNVSDSSRNLGSSPRMRGTPQTALNMRQKSGIIPAYAGNTRFYPSPSTHSRDHPRVCGEHVVVGLHMAENQGSSPRMRGTRFRRRIVVGAIGIIPAYAGNTIWLTRAPNTARDHPRVCGEHKYGLPVRLPIPGSSPRMRGTPIVRCLCLDG